MRTLSILLALVLVMTSGNARALSVGNPFLIELGLLAGILREHREKEGVHAKTWEEVRKTAPHLPELLPLLSPERRVALLSPPLEVPPGIIPGGLGGGTMIAVTRDPYHPVSYSRSRLAGGITGTLGDPVYGIILEDRNGQVSVLRMKPEKFSAFFRSKGLEQPAPSGLGDFPHEKKYRDAAWTQNFIGSCFVTAVVVLPVVWLISIVLRSKPRRPGRKKEPDSSNRLP